MEQQSETEKTATTENVEGICLEDKVEIKRLMTDKLDEVFQEALIGKLAFFLFNIEKNEK